MPIDLAGYSNMFKYLFEWYHIQIRIYMNQIGGRVKLIHNASLCRTFGMKMKSVIHLRGTVLGMPGRLGS